MVAYFHNKLPTEVVAQAEEEEVMKERQRMWMEVVFESPSACQAYCDSAWISRGWIDRQNPAQLNVRLPMPSELKVLPMERFTSRTLRRDILRTGNAKPILGIIAELLCLGEQKKCVVTIHLSGNPGELLDQGSIFAMKRGRNPGSSASRLFATMLCMLNEKYLPVQEWMAGSLATARALLREDLPRFAVTRAAAQAQMRA